MRTRPGSELLRACRLECKRNLIVVCAGSRLSCRSVTQLASINHRWHFDDNPFFLFLSLILGGLAGRGRLVTFNVRKNSAIWWDRAAKRRFCFLFAVESLRGRRTGRAKDM